MKKVFALILTVAIIAAMAVVPVSATTWDGEIVWEVTEDFEKYDLNTDAYTDKDRVNAPANVLEGVGGGAVDADGNVPQGDNPDIGAVIVAGKVNGEKALAFNRGIKHNGNPSYTMDYYSDFVEEKMAVEVTFMFEKLGAYGTCIRIGTDNQSLTEAWTFTNATAAIWSADGKNTIGVWDEANGVDDGNGRILSTVTEDLQPNTKYTLTFLLETGSDEYRVLLNGELMGTYVHYDTFDNIKGMRIDHHGYNVGSDGAEENIDILYYDDCRIGHISKDVETPTAEPTATPTPVPTEAPTAEPAEDVKGCGSVIMSGAAVMAVMAAAVVFLKKRK